MREFRTDPIIAGDHFLLDGVEYVAEEPNGRECDSCALHDSDKCYSIPCDKVIFKRVEKKPTYRPYKDTEEMIADWKERFMVDEIPDFCKPMIWVKDKPYFLTTVGTHLIVGIFEHVVRISNSIVPLQNLFDNYTYLDGSPCGKVEE